MKVDLVRARGAYNEIALLAYEPRRPRNVSIVAGHGYSSSKHNLDQLCAFLAAQGFALFNLDFPGHKLGSSGGTLRGIDDLVDAMNAAIAYARSLAKDPVLTLGHSMGAMTALFAAAEDASIAGVVSIATGYGRPSALEAMQSAGATNFRSDYVDGIALPELVRDVDARFDRALERLAGRPQLYIAAQRDAMVSLRSVEALYERAPEPKTFITVPSDHTYAAENARGAILQWLNGLYPR